jgi:PAS domain S-box-containing protein
MTHNNKSTLKLKSEIKTLKKQIQLLKNREAGCQKTLKALKSSEAKLQQLLKTTPARIANLDLDGNILFINHTTSKRPVREVLGKNVYDLIPPEEQKKLRQILKNVIKKGRKYRYEASFIHPNGKTSWWENDVAPIKRKGKVVEFIITATNITERKLAEIALQRAHDELKRSEQKRLLFLKTAPERIIHIDLKGTILYINHAETRPVKDIIGMDINQFIMPDERPRLRKIIDSMIETGKDKTYETYYDSPDGKKYFFDCIASPVKENGKVVEVLIIVADITERRKAEEALKESEAKFRTLAEKSPNMIFIIVKGRIVYVNKRYEEIMGLSKKEYYSPNFDMFKRLSPDSLKQAKKSFHKHLKGEEIPPYEYSFFTQNGEKIEAIISTKLIQYEGEMATLGVITDITERKKAEFALQKAHDALEQRVEERTNELVQANLLMRQEIEDRKRVEKTLKEREEMLRSILDSSPDAITMTDTDGTIIECNQSNIDMMGYSSRDELIGKSAFDLIAEKQHSLALENLQKTLDSGIIKNIEYTLVKRDGTEFPGEMSASIVQDAAGRQAGFVAVTKDITARKKAEEALIRSETELRKQKVALEEKNIALREIIAQIEIEKRKIEEDINTNVELVLSPILERLKARKADQKYFNLLQHHLKGLTSSFGGKITDRDINLTPREIEICNMIKGGMTSKDISKLLNISCQTVERHRKNIRHKLGIANKRVNLTSHLRKM